MPATVQALLSISASGSCFISFFSFQQKTLPEKCPLSGRAFISLLAHSVMEKIADFVDEAGFLFFDDRFLLFFRRFDRRDRDDELHAVN